MIDNNLLAKLFVRAIAFKSFLCKISDEVSEIKKNKFILKNTKCKVSF